MCPTLYVFEYTEFVKVSVKLQVPPDSQKRSSILLLILLLLFGIIEILAENVTILE